MITADRKPFDEIYAMTKGHDRVLVAGCDTCVAICMTGGEREAEVLASEIAIKAEREGRELTVEHTAAIRQCEWEYLDAIADQVGAAPVVLSMACGIGIQAMAERFAPKPVMPAVDTNMLGMPQEHAVWLERCVACGDCVLGLTAGICPVVRCAKSLMNGPCGGAHDDGLCEVVGEDGEPIECAWVLIWERLKAQGREEQMFGYRPPKDWSASSSGGPRRMVREDARPV
ncbi:MAG TPA: methylenetetrahydrofolate reductase C-terminal domain-containing protein [Actinomycetota bacterium]|nr:methylenetetrahydrofolate reductase C-terminal domain-containing protein [Actinomycetota bacterium]